MPSRPRKQGRMGALQEFEAVPITDPAEQAALAERIRRIDHEQSGRGRKSVKMQGPRTASEVLRLCRQLPPEEKLLLLTQLADGLSPEMQMALLKRFPVRMAR
jgi:hypothetical protein